MSQWPPTVTITVAEHELYIGQQTLQVTMITPTEGAVMTDAAVPVQWTFAPGTQATYRVRVWADAAQTILAYDSTVVSSGVNSHVIPEGSLVSGLTYYLQVDITTTAPQSGQSALIEFTTAFTPSVAVTGLVLATVGDRCELPRSGGLAPPAVPLRWSQVVPAGDETFVRYSVWRRRRRSPWRDPDGSDAWVRIASIGDIATVTYTDTAPWTFTVMEYAVTWTAFDTTANEQRSSARQDPAPTARIENEFIYLHDVSAPARYLAFFSDRATVQEIQDIAERVFWGRQRPSLFVGDVQTHRLQISAAPDIARGGLWPELRDLRTRQRTDAATLCLRIGSMGEEGRFFCGVVAGGRANAQATYEMNVDLVEVEYSEAVA